MCRDGKEEEALSLIKDDQINVNCQNIFQQTGLMFAAAQGRKVGTMAGDKDTPTMTFLIPGCGLSTPRQRRQSESSQRQRSKLFDISLDEAPRRNLPTSDRSRSRPPENGHDFIQHAGRCERLSFVGLYKCLHTLSR